MNRLCELSPMVRGSQDTESPNLWPTLLTTSISTNYWANGARDLLILNWFEESVAGRQGKGRQLDFRHGRHLDAPGPLAAKKLAQTVRNL